MSHPLLPSIASSFVPTVSQVSAAIALIIAGWLINMILYRPLTSPLRKLQCPPGGSGIEGHLRDILDYQGHAKIQTWINTLGPTMRVKGPMYINDRLWTIDSRAVSYIMENINTYRKPDMLRNALRQYMREGLIVSEGERHRIQRKVVQRLFSRNGMKMMAEAAQVKADQLRDILIDLSTIPTKTTPYCPDPVSPLQSDQTIREIDIWSATLRLTYDLIGQISIDHTFDSLGDWEGEGGKMFDLNERMQMFCQGSSGLRQMLTLVFPWINVISPSESSKRVKAAMDPLEKLSKDMMAERVKEITEGKRDAPSENRDLLTIMLKSNLAKDLSLENRLLDKEITGQLATFMFAGSDTTTGTVAWALYHLAKKPELQQRLRQECLTYGDTIPTEQIDEMIFMDAIVKEVLRINPSIVGTVREAMKDDIIPLAEAITLTDGTKVSEVRIRKGQLIHLPIENLNMSTTIYGPTAQIFDPTRWLPSLLSSTSSTSASTSNLTTSSPSHQIPKEGPGVWPNMMTFIDGPRRCVGYRLALLEVKMILFVLLRNFVFAPVPGKRIGKWNLFSTRPYVEGTLLEKGSSLPLLMAPYKGEK